MKRYRCTFCGHETETLTIGCIRIGCSECGKRGFEKYDRPEYDKIMRMLG